MSSLFLFLPALQGFFFGGGVERKKIYPLGEHQFICRYVLTGRQGFVVPGFTNQAGANTKMSTAELMDASKGNVVKHFYIYG